VLSLVTRKHLRLLSSPYFANCFCIDGTHGSMVVKALCHKPESRGFETRRCELIFLIYLIIPAALGPGVNSACNRNKYKKQEINVSGE
jgi:hypothetical protein